MFQPPEREPESGREWRIRTSHPRGPCTRGEPLSHRGIPEAELIREAVGGSEAAFAELVRRETPRVEAVAWGLSGDPTVAAEIAQDAMVRLHRALPSLRGAARLSTWLYRTVINLHHDRRRTQLRERRLIPMAEMGPMSSSSPGPDEQAEAGERARAVEAAVGALPAPMREAIVLRYFRGLDYAEIAEVLQCPSGTVASRMHRALRLVGALLAQHGIREGSL